MSEQIDEIIEKYKDLFHGKENDIRNYLKKHYNKIFSTREMLEVTSDDASERIKISGFHKNLSSWRNYYENITISSCLKIKGEEKRFDHKFLFTQEKLNAETIEVIEDAIKEINKLKSGFNFGDALAKIDDMIELIKDEEDRIYNRRLFKVRKEIIEAKENFDANKEKLEILENVFEDYHNKNELENMVNTCEILKIAKELKDGPLTRKYSKILDELKTKIGIKKDLERLERRLEAHKKRNEVGSAVNVCEKIIKLCKSNKDFKDDEDKYAKILEELQKEINSIKEKIEKLLDDYTPVSDDLNFPEALSNLNSLIELIQHQKFNGYEDYINRMQEKRKEILAAQEKSFNLSDDLSDLDKKLTDSIDDRKIFLALNYCNALIDISKRNKKPLLIQKYEKILDQINEKIEQIKQTVDQLLVNCDFLSENDQYDEAYELIDHMLKFLGQDLPEYIKKLRDKRIDLASAEENYRDFEEKLVELETELTKHLDNNNFIAAMKTCENILKFPKVTKELYLREKYEDILEEIKKKIEDIKASIDRFLDESIALTENKRFKEALNRIDIILELIGEQDLPEEIKKLTRRKNEITETQERFIKFTDNIMELENDLAENLKNNKYMAALSNCDILLQVAESSKKDKLIEKYQKIVENVSGKVDVLKNKIHEMMAESIKLSTAYQYDDAIANIDSALEFLKEYDLSEDKLYLEEKRKEFQRNKKKQQDLEEELAKLEGELDKYIENSEISDAADKCENLLRKAKSLGNQELIDKYSEVLRHINNKIGGLKSDIEQVLEESSKLVEETNFKDALAKLDDMLSLIDGQNLPEYKKLLEKKRMEILDEKKRKEKKPLEKPKIKPKEKPKAEAKSKKGIRTDVIPIDIDGLPCNECIDNLTLSINNIKERISENLKKLHIGVIHSTVNKVIGKIIDEEILLAENKLQGQVKVIKDIISTYIGAGEDKKARIITKKEVKDLEDYEKLKKSGGSITDKQLSDLEEYEQIKIVLEKFFQSTTDQDEFAFKFADISLLLNIYKILIKEIWQGQAHYRILQVLHGEKGSMSREELKKATGVEGAFVLKAIQELSHIDLIEFDEEKDNAKLLKRLIEDE